MKNRKTEKCPWMEERSLEDKKSTAQKLSAIGRKGESYDDLIIWLLENSKKRKASYKVDNKEG